MARPKQRYSPKQHRYRLGRCYELAWKSLAHDDRFAAWKLVHGEIVSPIGNGVPIGHAWLALGDQIYDPVFDVILDAPAYRAKYAAVPKMNYTQPEALRVGAKAGHFGPW